MNPLVRIRICGTPWNWYFIHFADFTAVGFGVRADDAFFRYNFNAVVFQDVPSEFGMHQHLFLFLLQNENKIEDFNLALAKQHTYSNRKEFKYFTQRLTLNLFISHSLQHCWLFYLCHCHTHGTHCEWRRWSAYTWILCSAHRSQDC